LGLFDKHKAMQSLPAHRHARVNWTAIVSSPIHLGLLCFYILWFVAYFVLIFTGRHNLWLGIANLIVVISFFPFQLITPKRRLARAFLKLNIRPSHCGYCEYDLRATEGDTCPECGTRLAPKCPVTPGKAD
jgi:hypothetical protein